jgi:predicted kinase
MVHPHPLHHHLLIGLPGSGKTTLAKRWCAENPACCHVSTDRIRHILYGDASEQGEWDEILGEILKQAHAAVTRNQTILYDATNAQREHRIDILRQLRQQIQQTAPDRPVYIHGWYLLTPLEECHRRNHLRRRTVPAEIIDRMYASLQAFPPQLSEGFTSLNQPPRLTPHTATPPTNSQRE